ncbi:MAG: hypothetical protein ACWGOD_08995, partial [Desulfobulbales bacterium]
KNMVELLVKNGANLQVKYEDGSNLVKKAVVRGYISIARFLAQKGVEVDKESANILDGNQ